MFKKLTLTLAAFCAAGIFAAEKAAIAYPGYSLEADKGGLVIKDGSGSRLLKIGRQLFSWAPPVAYPETVTQIAPDTLKVDYRIDKDKSGQVALAATFRATPAGTIFADYELTAPEGMKTGGIMQELQPIGVKKLPELFKSGLWTRDANGGVPYEVRDGYFRGFHGKHASVWLQLGGNANYTSSWAEHLSYKKNESGKQSASCVFQLTPPGATGAEAAALLRNRPLTLTLATGKPFNLWDSGVPEFTVNITNPGSQTQNGIELAVTARDYDGRSVLNEKRLLTLAPHQSETLKFQLPEAERMIWFAEASVKQGGKEQLFARTSLAVLPPHEFQDRENSRFGMSAYFPVPDMESVYKLMRRIGVRILRHGDNRECAKYGLLALDHANVPKAQDPSKDKARLDQILKRAMEFENPEIEFCNEWNMGLKPEFHRKYAERYAKLLRQFRQLCKERNSDIRIIGMGIAGDDPKFVRALAAAGAWEYFDGGIAMHPGRGNFTPDYEKNQWSYLGSIRRFKKVMGELGEKPIHLSEVYAATHANDWWKDSERQAAENVVLTYALGLAEGVASIQFYQLHDAVWHDIGGVNHKDSEYSYGLLRRDGAVKPSLLAYAAVAEQLDGAKFRKYLTFNDPQVKGVGFDTPRGPLAVVYDRTDGMVQSKKAPDFIHLEPWVDHWETHREVTLPAISDEVTVIDPIGRATQVKAVDGKVTLTLSGAPLMVYGLQF